ncbi:STAS domain-containing protein [Amycolatopsis sp. NPDC059027]|uniref:STAS domain-containing protein n=1 Tax=unclassified Amycolatopsis TaxID=2618356 RepID=UPI003672D648
MDFLSPEARSAPGPQLTVRTALARPDVVLLDVIGEVDLSTRPILDTALTAALHREPEVLIVDLTEVSFLGSTGLSLLVESNLAAIVGGTDLRIASHSHTVQRLLRLTGVDRELHLYPSRSGALRDVGRG